RCLSDWSSDVCSSDLVMTEEMRHGWQMSYLLCSHFGDEGKREAAKLLERRADEGQRLLGSFNELVDNWLDFFTYTQFIDRDGKRSEERRVGKECRSRR